MSQQTLDFIVNTIYKNTGLSQALNEFEKVNKKLIDSTKSTFEATNKMRNFTRQVAEAASGYADLDAESSRTMFKSAQKAINDDIKNVKQAAVIKNKINEAIANTQIKIEKERSKIIAKDNNIFAKELANNRLTIEKESLRNIAKNIDANMNTNIRLQKESNDATISGIKERLAKEKEANAFMNQFNKDQEKYINQRNKALENSLKPLTVLQNKVKQYGLEGSAGNIDLAKSFDKLNYNIINATTVQERFTKKQITMTRAIKDAKKAADKMDFAFLQLQFTGMMLQTVFGGVIKSLFNSYKTAREGNSAFLGATNRLGAAWEYTKFAIMSALEQPGVIWLIDKIVELVNWIGEWFSQNPMASQFMLGMIALMAAGGVFLSFVGSLAAIEKTINAIQLMKFPLTLFDPLISGFNTAMGTTVGGISLSKLLAGALAVKIIWDLAQFVLGNKSLEETISNIGWSLTGIGFATANPWLIGIGLTMILLPNEIAAAIKWLTDLIDKVSNYISEKLKFRVDIGVTPGTWADKFLKFITGQKLDEPLEITPGEAGRMGPTRGGEIHAANYGKDLDNVMHAAGYTGDESFEFRTPLQLKEFEDSQNKIAQSYDNISKSIDDAKNKMIEYNNQIETKTPAQTNPEIIQNKITNVATDEYNASIQEANNKITDLSNNIDVVSAKDLATPEQISAVTKLKDELLLVNQALNGGEEGIGTTALFIKLNDAISILNDYLVNTFIITLNNEATALNSTATALRNAAAAQREYNAAKRGE